MPRDTFSVLSAPRFEGSVVPGTGALESQRFWGAEPDLVRRGRGGWARRRTSAAGRWGRCASRHDGDRNLPLEDGSLPVSSACGLRRVALAVAPSPDTHPERCRGQAAWAWQAAPAPRPRGRRPPVHQRLRWAPAAAFQGGSGVAGVELRGTDRLLGTWCLTSGTRTPGHRAAQRCFLCALGPCA